MHKSAFQAVKSTFMHGSGFPHHILIKNQLIKHLVFYQNMVGKNWDMHKRAFLSQKRTSVYVFGLPPSYFDLKNQMLYKYFFKNQNMVGEDLRHA